MWQGHVESCPQTQSSLVVVGVNGVWWGGYFKEGEWGTFDVGNRQV